jgi:peptidoglycan/xylan/chitin deacetylase (PgdA/CDA1 family)
VSVEKYDQGLVVLNYHNITKNGGTFSRSPEQFREDMEFIKINDFNPITPILFLSYLEGKGNLPEKPVLITFDDGLNGVYLNAYPILQEYGYSAIMFIIVSRIGQNLDYLNWKQLSEMQSSRIFSIESHTYNSHFFVDNVSGRHAALISKLILPDGSIESEEQYVSRVTDDLQKSKSLIEDKLNKKVLFLAIPFGNGDPTITKISNNLGFKGTFNSGGGVNPLPFSSWNVKRITIKSTDLLSDYLY